MIFSDIPRVAPQSRTEFANYMRAAVSPLVIQGAMDRWPAMSTWSFDFFTKNFGEYPVEAHAPQLGALASWTVRTTLGHYLHYLADPMARSIAGEWVKGDIESLRQSGFSLYAGNFNPAHRKHGKPDLIFRHVPPLPDFIDSWHDLLDPTFRSLCEEVRSHFFVYLSTTGGQTPLHHDFWSTHAFLAQVTGTKWAALFDPQYAKRLYQESSGDVRKMAEDAQFADVPGWATMLSPGDILVMPAGWLHYVETLEPSITYSADWIDANNWRRYVDMASKALRAKGLIE
jgi:hypothetical protein